MSEAVTSAKSRGLIAEVPTDAEIIKGCAVCGLVPSYGLVTAEQVVSSLSAPHACFVEAIGDTGLAETPAVCLAAPCRGGIVMAVTTTTACSLDLPSLFGAAVHERLPRTDRAMVELCLSEAISNAVIHGNLGIDNGLRATNEAFDHFRRVMDGRLSDPALARRRVVVALELTIPRPQAPSFRAGSGRGDKTSCRQNPWFLIDGVGGRLTA